MAARIDLFCRVVDNYGDAGVAWRIARQLAAGHALAVTLWIDDLATLARIVPGVDPGSDDRVVAGVRVRRLVEPMPPYDVPGAVVEAFGCKLPEEYAAALAGRAPPPAWLVLEHLSAEAWVDTTHGLPSPHPRLPLVRRFCVPGFTAASGGLPRERALPAARDAFRANRDAATALWRRLGVAPPAPGELAVSLFCYPNRALPALLDAWSRGPERVRVLVPEGVARDEIGAWAGGAAREAPGAWRRGSLALATFPFVPQDDYDRLLWAADVNFVRGEDSFVRAQWAARPFVWQPYRQAEGAHAAKREAFLARFATGLPDGPRAALERFWRAWDTEDGRAAASAWRAFRAERDALAAHGERWSEGLARLPDLTETLVGMAGFRV